MATGRKINDEGLAIIKLYEGLGDGDTSTPNLDPYMDPIEIWSIGYGRALRDKEGRFLRGLGAESKARAQYPGGITLEQANTFLREDSATAAKDVEKTPAVLTDNQFSALVSFVFNLGGSNYRASTLRRMIVAGDYLAAAEEFPKWNKAGGAVLRGLVRRRAAERALFEKVDNV